MIVDPWGEVVARCDEAGGEGIAVAEVDAEWVASVRTRMPLESHRRYEVYERVKCGGGGAAQAPPPAGTVHLG